ncbi:MAG TPA: ABC transporter permease [Steroidobacteraceae bacterium]|nr:ABC transporter permease [Steroidobacteraceae bacterium]
MRMRPVAGVMLRQFYLMRGSPARVLPMFAWVAIDIVLWGFITRYLGSVAGTRVNFVASLLGAVLMWDFFTRIMQGVTTAFLEDVWSRNFLNFFATPLAISEYLTGLIATSILASLVGLSVMLVLASTVFGLSFFALGLALVPFLLILFLFGIALGVLATALVLRLGPASEWMVWPLPALISPFVGVFYPLATLPAWMRAVAHALPPSYVFQDMRAIVAGRAFAVGPLIGGIVLALAQIALCTLFFVRVYRYAVRTGLLARYSAESAN